MNDEGSQSDDQARRRAAERRALARNATTTPERLRELAAEADAFPGERKRFAAALAANLNVPTDLVSRYLYLAPGAFCRNPAATNWTLDAEFLSRTRSSPYYPRSPLPFNLRQPLPSQQATLFGLGRLLRSTRAPRPLVRAIAAQNAYPYLASTAQSHLHMSSELAPESAEMSLAQYWMHALAREMNEMRRKLLQQLFDYGLVPAALPSLLPVPRPATNDTSEGTAAESRRWTSTRMLERELSVLKDTIATGIPTASPVRIREVTRENLIRKSLAVEEPDLLEDASATILLYRTLALLHAPESLRRAKIREFAESSLWHDRVAAALALRPFPGEDELRPRYQTLLERLARDGNRYVRAVAQRRLLEPDWRFAYFQA